MVVTCDTHWIHELRSNYIHWNKNVVRHLDGFLIVSVVKRKQISLT